MLRTRLAITSFPSGTKRAEGSTRAFIGISLNNKTMEAPHLLNAIFDWTKQNVGAFDLLVGDSLTRHNYRAFDGQTEGAAFERAMKSGEEAKKFLESLLATAESNFSAEVISSYSLCEQRVFSNRLDHFERCYANNLEFKNLIDQGVDEFLLRRHSKSMRDRVKRDFCVAYQLEELVIFEQLSAKGYSTFVYPGAHLPVMKRLVSSPLNNVSADLERLKLVELRVFEDKKP
jgi:tRNA-dependent cyclodipeptide synthase